MKNFIHSTIAKIRGKNLDSTPVDVIINQMNEKRPLPLGMTEFEEWSDRIISGTLLPDNAQLRESQKYALANMLLHLSPTQDHETDGYFIKSLRKYAVNQIADAVRKDLYEKAKAKKDAETPSAEQVPPPIMSRQ